MELRPPQAECFDAVMGAFQREASVLVVCPTGWGKTVLFAALARAWPSGRVLILAHREELIFQAAAKVESATGEKPDIEMADFRASPSMYGGAKVVVASVASLYRENRLKSTTYHPAAFGLVVVDEAHHCSTENVTYTRILEHFRANPDLRVLGVTATPDRSDGKPLGDTFGSVAYRYTLRRAVDDGWLVPIKQQYVICESLDFSRVKLNRSGDFTEDGMAAVMEEERALHEVVGPTLELAGDRPTLIFASSIHHAERVAEIINRHGRGAVCVHGGNPAYQCSSDQRRRRLQEFNEGGHQFLVGCDCFYEGFDSPRIACVAVARPTKSRSRYTQAVGRGTRVLPDVRLHPDDATARLAAIAASGKPDVLVLDFVGASSTLKLDLVSTADILAGDGSSGEAVGRAKRKAKDAGGSADMRELVAAAERELADESAERERRKALVARTTHQAVAVDPFGYGGEEHAGAAPARGTTGPSGPQLALLAKYGIDGKAFTRKQASAVLDKVTRKPTTGQAKVLAKYGESPDCHRDKAGALLDLIAARGWRPRDFPLTPDRFRLRREGQEWMAVVQDGQGGRVVLKRRFASEADCRAYIENCVERPAAAVA